MVRPLESAHSKKARPASRRGEQADMSVGATVGTKDHGDIPNDAAPGEAIYPKNGAGPTDPAG